MGIWNLYFATKLALFFGHYMGFHVFANLAFAVCLFIPIRHTHFKLLRLVVAIPIAAVLFYYDTWLPPFSGLISQAANLQQFNLSYLIELLARFISLPMIAVLAALGMAYFLVRKKVWLSPLVLLAMLIPLLDVGTQPIADEQAAGQVTDEKLSASLEYFYSTEKLRSTSFTPPDKSDLPFDIIFLNICSLSWDDLDYVKEKDNPLFKRFDIIFTNFNAAATYSGPSIIRLLRGSCGQKKHARLYDPINAQCQTFNNLQQMGFDPQLVLNHDGQYGNLLGDIQQHGGLQTAPFNNAGIPPYLNSFDGSPIYDDYAVLAKWWANRLTLPAPRVALYYNSISLHDGNRYVSNPASNSREIYHPRLLKLLDNLDRFFASLSASGRRAVVVFVPEHGAAMRGDKMQISGMREIPSTGIGIVPVGIKLIGLTGNEATQAQIVFQASSHLAVATLLSNFISHNPFGVTKLDWAEYVRDLPVTEYVAENEDIVVMRRGDAYYLRSKDGKWVEYAQ